MSYAEILPGTGLGRWVECYWSRAATAEPVRFRILPDGCADLIFDLSGERTPLGPAFAVGTMTRALLLEGEGSPELFGIRFRPGAAGAFFRLPLANLTDQRVSASALDLAVRRPALLLAEELAQGRTMAQRVLICERRLRSLLAAAPPDARVERAVTSILRSGGSIDVSTLAGESAVSRQHLARLFDQHVGLTPKLFSRVTRFRRALTLAGTQSWSSLAAEVGYADQSHLIADFREFSGSTPVPFLLSAQEHER